MGFPGGSITGIGSERVEGIAGEVNKSQGIMEAVRTLGF
jgi:hypothetical protein